MYLVMANKPFKTVKEIQAWKPTNIAGERRRVDGAKGLYVKGEHTGTKTFVVRKSYKGQMKWLKIGSTSIVTLSSARRLADLIGDALETERVEAVKKALIGCVGDYTLFTDKLQNTKLGSASELTVDKFMKQWLPIKQASLAAGPSRNRPESLYRMHFQPTFGDFPLNELEDSQLFNFFEELYQEKYPTGSKLRGIMEEAFNNARNKGYINSNPIPLARDLPKRRHKAKPHRTMSYASLPPFWKAVEKSNFNGSTKALILTGMITGLRFKSVQRVKGKHIDFSSGLWTIPKIENTDSDYRIKSGDSFEMQLPKEFWNKLSFLLELDLTDIGKDDFVFKSATRTGSPVSQTNVTKCIESTGFKTSFHGFRNAIKIWGRDNGYQDWLMDEYCQHALKGLDRSYRRATYLEQRSEVTDRLTAFVLNSSES